MSKATIHALLNGNEKIIEFYKNAEKLWGEIWKDNKSDTVEGLAELLSNYQLDFEHECGGRYLGQEIMAFSGFGLLYDSYVGFEGESKEKAIRLNNAFKKSNCSIEVEGSARRAVELYNLED